MKNREKYKNELMNVIKIDGRICGFMKKHDVYRIIGTDWEHFCEMDCIACGIALQLWLDEEYEEPEVDWSKVPVDTLVRVRNRKENEWLVRYFKGFDEKRTTHKFLVWSDGRTSKTVGGHGMEPWKYCELVEAEDDK